MVTPKQRLKEFRERFVKGAFECPACTTTCPGGSTTCPNPQCATRIIVTWTTDFAERTVLVDPFATECHGELQELALAVERLWQTAETDGSEKLALVKHSPLAFAHSLAKRAIERLDVDG